MKKTLHTIFYILFLSSAFATTRYVKPTATGIGDGTSWANASADLQAMINASSSGDEVWVAAGVYKPLADGSGNTNPSDNRNKLFYMKDGVKLYGGFVGTETLFTERNFATNKTILSGDIDNNDTNTDGNFINETYLDIQGNNAYHVMVFPSTSETTELDGFIITGGKNTPSSGSSTHRADGYLFNSFRGAALYCGNSAPKIRNCVVSGNDGDSGVLYQNNQNSASGWTTIIENVIWIGNYARIGVLYSHRGPTEVTNNVFVSNTSNSSTVFISTNMPNGNSIIYNHISVYNNSFGSSLLQLGGGSVQIKNSTIWNDVPANNPLINNSAHSLNVSNSSIQGSGGSLNWNTDFGTDGGNNIDLAPQFSGGGNITGTDGNYYTADDGLIPSSCSPLVNNGGAGSTLDIAGQSRPNEAQNDIGAYEFQGASTIPANATAVSSNTYSITCGQTVTLNGACSTGTLTWYGQAAGGISIGTGNGFVVSPLVNPTIYYASCETSTTCVSLERVATPEITVSLPANPTAVSVSDNDICPSTVIDLTASCASPAIPEWYDASLAVIGSGNTIQVSPNSSTTYSVKCKNGACLSAEEEITVNVLARPTNDNASPSVICEGQSVTYTANCAVGTVEWYDNSRGGNMIATGNSYTFTPSHGTSSYYRIFPACTNGTCTSNRVSADSYYFFAAPNVAVSDTLLCVSDNTTLTLTATCSAGVGGSVANWYDAASGGNLLGTGNSFNHTPTASITYYAECVSNNYSCSTTRTATAQVTVGQPVTSPMAVSVNNTTACANTDIILSANCTTGTPTWYTQPAGGRNIGTGQSFVYNVSSTATYYVSCEDGGCISSRVATPEVSILPSSGGLPASLNLSADINGTETHQALEYITANNTIESTARVVFESGKAIQLNEGFETQANAVFRAEVGLSVCP